MEKTLSLSWEFVRLEDGVGDSGVLMCLPNLRRLPMPPNGSSSDSFSTSDLARGSKKMSIIALTGFATRVLWGFLGEYNGERNEGREPFVVTSNGRKGARSASGENMSFWKPTLMR